MDRKEAIMWLKIIRANLVDFPEISNKKKIEALDMAIRSVEIDEAYQLEYEKTNELFNDLQQGLQEAIEIEKAEDRRMTNGEHLLKQYPILNEYSLSQKGLYMSCCFPLEWWNAEYSNDECNTEGVINSSFVREVLESRQAKAEDCISRADLNQILWDYDCKNENALMVKAIAELPSVYPKSDKPSGEWIPISEKLPEESGYYLVSGKGKVWICEMLNLMGIKGWSNDASNPIVEAWQPLPKPYEVE